LDASNSKFGRFENRRNTNAAISTLAKMFPL
jgi:hypothetical protein